MGIVRDVTEAPVTVRVLGEDRSCLAGLPVTDLARVLPAGRARTVVVEEGGRVVGTMTVALVPHVEATWIDPAHRNAGVTRALIRATWDLARDGGAEWGFAGTESDAVADALIRLGGVPLPHTFLMMPLDGRV
jgi:GNAT superfamily N-acetyltransferase